MNVSNGLIELFGAVIIFILWISCFLKYKSNDLNIQEKKRISIILLMEFLAVLTDSVTWFLDGAVELKLLMFLFLFLAFATINLVLVCAHLYIVSLVEINKKISNLYRYSSHVICFFSVLIWTVGLKYEWFIYIYTDGRTYNTDWFWISQVEIGIAFLIDMIYVFINRKYISGRKALYIELYGIAPLLSIPLEIILECDSLPYIAITISAVIIYVTLFSEQERTIYQQENELSDKKVKIMLSQIQPHFLYNSITSIMVLCKKDSDEAVEALSDFADYLRGNLSAIGEEAMIPFASELKHIEAYLRLEKLRFKEKLNVDYIILEKRFMVPTLTIQPLIENAVKHGIERKVDGGTVTIKTFKENDKIVLEISDDGVGFTYEPDESSNSEHIGLNNVKRRLKICANADMEIKSEIGKGTVITITFEENNV